MDLKLDLTKAVKIVIAKDETHHVEYIIDNGEIKDVNLIEIDNSQEKSCDKKAVELDPPVNNPEYNDRYFIDKAAPLAEKILNGRKMVATVQDGISDTSAKRNKRDQPEKLDFSDTVRLCHRYFVAVLLQSSADGRSMQPRSGIFWKMYMA